MPLCGKAKTEEMIESDRIDKKIKNDQKKFKLTHRIPVVGAGESGKSTLIKQMQILYINDFDDDQRREKIPDIRNNCRDGMLSITAAMRRIDPPVDLEHAENQARVDYIQTESVKPDFVYDETFFEHCRVLWADAGIQKTFSRANEFQLIDSAKYFLDQIERVALPSFLPDNQDMLRCRVLTSGIFETKFSMNKIFFHMFDVGGQREERRKWLQVFHDVTAVIFVCACSAYDMTLREMPTQNRLKESIELFGEVWNNRYLRQTSMILFLNKQDLFTNKILCGNTRLETFFPTFSKYPQPAEVLVANGTVPHTSGKHASSSASNAATSSAVEDPRLTRAKCFIRDQFISTSQRNNDGTRRCYPHYTTAVDTENIKRVFGDCQDMLQRVYMQKMGLM